MGCVEDVASVLLGRGKLILDTLLVDTGVTCQIGLLGVELVLNLLLLQLRRLVVVLEKQVVGAVTQVLRQRVLVILNLLVIGRSAERATLCELCRRRGDRGVGIGIRDVCVCLVDHRLQLGIVADVLVISNRRGLAEVRIRTRIYIELTTSNAKQSVVLGNLRWRSLKRPTLRDA